MAASQEPDASRLHLLPTDVLVLILGYLDTARSVAHLAAVCRGLYRLVSAEGWRIFVKSCFCSLTLPATPDQDWAHLARVLTAQSRDWDRRAFVFHSLSPPEARRPGARRGNAAQSIPGNVLVDAYQRRRGRFDEELVVWGSGEDVVARIKRNDQTGLVSEDWHWLKGSASGFVAGKDDTTAISIVKSPLSAESEDVGVIVGRANGDLRMLSLGDSGLGRTLMHFRPSPSTHPNGIQAIDVNRDSGVMAASTRDSVWLYPIQDLDRTISDDVIEPPCIDPTVTASLRSAHKSSPFDYIRSIKTLNQETLVVSVNRSFDPIRILQITPAGLEMSTPARVLDEHPYMGSNPRTVRSLLPVDARSVASGSAHTLLSSWDDGTIRLQDLRTPSPVDRVYQDNFEVATPVNALISHGLERFVAGSAYSHMLKIFDFRWTKGYYHTDSLPCTRKRPYPTPRPPTIVNEPAYDDDRPVCNHVLGRLCRWHALSRHDFYRPNCNIYLPFRNYASSPIYSLAKPSDVSPTIYAGLSGLLVEFTVKSGMQSVSVPDTGSLYTRQRGKVAILETGDGSAISDVSKCQRVPEIRRQSFSNMELGSTMARKQHRLDEALQDYREWQDLDSLTL